MRPVGRPTLARGPAVRIGPTSCPPKPALLDHRSCASASLQHEIAASDFCASRNAHGMREHFHSTEDPRRHSAHSKAVAIPNPSATSSDSASSDFEARQGSGASVPGQATRRALLGAVGGAAAWWFFVNPPQTTGDGSSSVIPGSDVPRDIARAACLEGAAICAVLHSQISSTMRQLSAGFLPEPEFQSACQRRVGSSFIAESFFRLEDAIATLGRDLAYPPPTGSPFTLFSHQPRLGPDPAQREHYERLTLTSLQRCRRVQRLLTAMSQRNKYRPAGMQLVSQDLKYLCMSLEELVSAVPGGKPGGGA